MQPKKATEVAAIPAIKSSNAGLELTDLREVVEFATIYCQSGLQGTVKADVIMKLQMGQELGFSPMQAINSIYIVNGRGALETLPMKALVMNSGLCESCQDGIDGDTAWCEVKRVGQAKRRETFSMDDAKRAGLHTKDVWKNYPDRMLRYRAMSIALRFEFPDVLRGIHSKEEMMDAPPPEALDSSSYSVSNVSTEDLENAEKELFGEAEPVPDEPEPVKKKTRKKRKKKDEPEATEPTPIPDSDVTDDVPTPDASSNAKDEILSVIASAESFPDLVQLYNSIPLELKQCLSDKDLAYVKDEFIRMKEEFESAGHTDWTRVGGCVSWSV